MEEIWKPINDYGGYYEVSNLTRVRSIDRVVNSRPGVFQRICGKILAISKKRNNYCVVSLSKDGVSKQFWIHRVVAKAFIPNPKNYPCINHKDGNPQNNKIENLEWCTHSQNTVHAYKTNLMPIDLNSGDKNGRSKIDNETALTIRECFKNMSGLIDYRYRDLAEIYGSNKTSVYGIISRKNWNIEKSVLIP